MRAKQVEFEVTYVNLRDKPDWFLKISPHGKVPVLLVDEQPLFESNAIAEFLDEEVAPRLSFTAIDRRAASGSGLVRRARRVRSNGVLGGIGTWRESFTSGSQDRLPSTALKVAVAASRSEALVHLYRDDMAHKDWAR